MSTLETPKNKILERMFGHLERRMDRLFTGLFLLQWPALTLLAWFITPYTWESRVQTIHPHVYVSFGFGALVSVVTLIQTTKFKTFRYNKYILSSFQMLYSAMFIHVTGGRIESHFHIFGSLAFLAGYRSTGLLLWASLVTILDHAIRGVYWPSFVYGTPFAAPWRLVEHGSWVVFENIFLILSIRVSQREMMAIAESQAELREAYHREREESVNKSTQLEVQEQAMVSTSRMTSLGEMAAGIAHEINNPLAIIIATSELLRSSAQQGEAMPSSEVLESLEVVDRTALKITKIVKGLRNLSRDSSAEEAVDCRLEGLVEEVLGVCEQKFKSNGIRFTFDDRRTDTGSVRVGRLQVTQVMVNLLNNAFDAVSGLKDRWIKISAVNDADRVKLLVSDSGEPIPASVRARMFTPFYTTKEVGKGTGLGLSISRSLMSKMGGELNLLDTQETCFELVLPRGRR